MTQAAATSYAKTKARSKNRAATESADARSIGKIPAVRNPRRRARALRSLRYFLEQYFPDIFFHAWSPDHLTVIEHLEDAIVHGRLMALAMPRSSGKTSLVECAAIWAAFTGRRKYIVILGAEGSHAENILGTIWKHLTDNPELTADWPEVCYPLQRLEGVNQRRLIFGKKTIDLKRTKNKIILPDIPGSRCSGTIIETAGLLSGIRGKKHAPGKGKAVRPDLCLVDDPQTDESANSTTLTARRLKIMKGAVLGLGGVGIKLSVIATVTVIAPEDMAAQLLDRQANPQWRGLRFQLMRSMPSADLWDEYFRIRSDDFRADGDGSAATEFYIDNRDALDEGADPAWKERFDPGEVSAIQHAMNLLHERGKEAFDAEYQNDPQLEDNGIEALDEAELRLRLNHVARKTVPSQCTHLTAFVDVHKELLYWMVIGWESGFTGHVVDFGTYPEQRRTHFRLTDVRNTLKRKLREIPSLEGRLYKGLHNTFSELFSTDWKRTDGTSMKIARLMVDAQWGQGTKTVYDAISQSDHRANVFPSHGHYIGCNNAPISLWKKKAGEVSGDEWRIGPNRGIMRATFDANHWKSFSAARLLSAPGTPGAIMLPGSNGEAHRLLSEHLCSEESLEAEGRRRIHEWRQKSGKPDNHWWDCFVGNCMINSTLGQKVAVPDGDYKPKPRKQRASEDLME